MDLFDALEIGARLPWRVVRWLSGTIPVVLVVGWSRQWPVAYPIVQHVLDQRAQQMLDLVLSFLE